MTKCIRAGLWPIFVITMITMVCAYVQSMGNARADVATEYYETNKRLKGDMSNVGNSLEGWEHIYGILERINSAISGFKNMICGQAANAVEHANQIFSSALNDVLATANGLLPGFLNDAVAVVIQELSQFKDNMLDQIFDLMSKSITQ